MSFLILSFLRYRSKKTAYTKAAKRWADEAGKEAIKQDFEKMKKYCKIIRVLCHTQVKEYGRHSFLLLLLLLLLLFD